jgi:geranylgeranyl pyrophosphate synthase
MELKPSLELELYRLYHSTLLRAHFGQAIDIGTRIDDVPKDRVFDTCMASLELKSGTLTAFALGLGAIVGDCDPKILRILLQFGHEFGTGLQMLDDIGNFCGAKDPEKKWEDIKLWRHEGRRRDGY